MINKANLSSPGKGVTRRRRDSRQRGGNWGHLERVAVNPDRIIVIKEYQVNKRLSVFDAVKLEDTKEKQ